MARSYSPVPKRYTLTDGDEREQEIVVDGPDQAAEAFWAFAEVHGDAAVLAIEDPVAEESLVLLAGRGAVARVDGVDDMTIEYCAVENPRRYRAFVMLFFENGYRGLDQSAQWLPDLADLDASPEAHGEQRAADVSTENEAIDEVLRIWSDSGIVDPSNQYYVFFDTHTLEMSRAERAELAKLIEFLGLERVEPPAGATDGEVWVRTDSRIEAEIENWA